MAAVSLDLSKEHAVLCVSVFGVFLKIITVGT